MRAPTASRVPSSVPGPGTRPGLAGERRTRPEERPAPRPGAFRVQGLGTCSPLLAERGTAGDASSGGLQGTHSLGRNTEPAPSRQHHLSSIPPTHTSHHIPSSSRSCFGTSHWTALKVGEPFVPSDLEEQRWSRYWYFGISKCEPPYCFHSCAA